MKGRPCGARLAARTSLALVLLVALITPAACAHRLESSLLEVRELDGGAAQLRWKRSAGSTVLPLVPYVRRCKAKGSPEIEAAASGTVEFWYADCHGGLTGRRIGIDGLLVRRANVLLRVTSLDGRVFEAVLSASRSSVEVPSEFSSLDVVRQHTAQLGEPGLGSDNNSYPNSIRSEISSLSDDMIGG